MSTTFVEGDIAVAVIDALTSQICVVDPKGVIFAVNRAWERFAADNTPGQVRGHICVSYLNVCRHSVGPASEEAPDFANGLRAVLGGERECFQMEYPCRSKRDAMVPRSGESTAAQVFLDRAREYRRGRLSYEHY